MATCSRRPILSGRSRLRCSIHRRVRPGYQPEAPRGVSARAARAGGERQAMPRAAAQICPTLAAIRRAVEWFATCCASARARGGHALNRMWPRPIFATSSAAIRVPTLVLCARRIGERGRARCERIPHLPATIAIAGNDYWGMFLSPEIVEELDGFVDARAAPVPDSVLTTVLFTDLVGSTAQARGARRSGLAELLARTTRASRRELARFRGGEADTAGDGFFARFDGPARAIRCAAPSPRRFPRRPRASRGDPHRRVRDPSTARSRASPSTSAPGRGARQTPASPRLEHGQDLVAGSGIAFDDRGDTSFRASRAHGACTAVPTRLREIGKRRR